jgi:hypothetical protein
VTHDELIEKYALVLFVNVHAHQPFLNLGTRNDADMKQAREIVANRIADMIERFHAAYPDKSEAEALETVAGALDVLTMNDERITAGDAYHD